MLRSCCNGKESGSKFGRLWGILPPRVPRVLPLRKEGGNPSESLSIPGNILHPIETGIQTWEKSLVMGPSNPKGNLLVGLSSSSSPGPLPTISGSSVGPFYGKQPDVARSLHF